MIRYFRHIVLGYLLLPFLIFSCSFLRIEVGFVVTALVLFCVIRNWALMIIDDTNLFLSKKEHVFLIFIALSTCFMLGIGSFWSQSPDFVMKNPLLHDLIKRDWPLIYDLSDQPLETQQVIGKDRVGFVYYLFFYLPAALIGKMFGSFIGRLAFLLWSALGLYMLFVGLSILIKRHNEKIFTRNILFIVLLSFFTFGGLDAIGDIVLNPGHFRPGRYLFGYIEGWMDNCYFSGYMGICSHLVSAFNQCIPVYLIVVLLLLETSSNRFLALSSLTIMYSPWACLGLFPLVLFKFVSVIKNTEERSSLYSCFNVILSAVILFISLAYYKSNSNSVSFSGPFWLYVSAFEFSWRYFLFIFVELGIYIFFLNRLVLNNNVLILSFLILFIIPFYRVTVANDFMMRGSICPLFIIFVYWMIWLSNNFKKKILLLLFLTGVPQIQSFLGKMYNGIVYKEITLYEDFKTFGYIDNKKSEIYGVYYSSLCDQQFFSHEFYDTFFWLYLAKKSK